jgi:predicted RNA polymerase sigma factor
VEVLGRRLSEGVDTMAETEFDLHVEDDVLRLMFLTCHPAVPRDGRVALTLKLVAGLTTEQIARLFLVPPATLAQRIVRAKRTLAEVGAGVEVPVGEELAARLGSVLQVVYAVFTEGYAATSGPAWARVELCDEAMRLGRMLAALAPSEPEVHGLVALMHLHASRLRARVGPAGRAVPLDEQDRGRWDWMLITYGLRSLERGEQLVVGAGTSAGPYLVQAQIAACHARAATVEVTDWQRIAALYGILGKLTPSPVVELNRAVAVSMVDGPAAALPLVDALAAAPAMKSYALLPATRADLLRRLGRLEEARGEYQRAAGLTANSVQRTFLLERAAECASC